MKKALLALAMTTLAATFSLAQEASQKSLAAPAVVSQEQTRNVSQQPAAEVAKPNPSPSLKPGHPLDPADVDVLTGKNSAASAGARTQTPYRYGYPGYPAYAPYPIPGDNLLGRRIRPPFLPLPLSRFDGQKFFMTRNANGLPLFFSGRRRKGNFLFFPPPSVAFAFRRR